MAGFDDDGNEIPRWRPGTLHALADEQGMDGSDLNIELSLSETYKPSEESKVEPSPTDATGDAGSTKSQLSLF